MEQGQSLEEEEAHLMVALRGNGYPSSFIRSAAAAARAPREEVTEEESTTQEEEKPPLALIPYVAGVSERIKRACRNFNGLQIRPNTPFSANQGKGSSSCVKTLERCVRDSMRMWEGLHRRD